MRPGGLPGGEPGCWAAVRRGSCTRCCPCTDRKRPTSGSVAATAGAGAHALAVGGKPTTGAGPATDLSKSLGYAMAQLPAVDDPQHGWERARASSGATGTRTNRGPPRSGRGSRRANLSLHNKLNTNGGEGGLSPLARRVEGLAGGAAVDIKYTNRCRESRCPAVPHPPATLAGCRPCEKRRPWRS